MYLLGTAYKHIVIDITDEQDQTYTIENEDNKLWIIDLNGQTGSVTVYNKVDFEEKNWNSTTNNRQGGSTTYYKISSIPCTIYRNLKKIDVKAGTTVSPRYVRINK